MEKKRINIRMALDLHDWYELESSRLGIAKTALIVMAMNEYRKQSTTIRGIPELSKMVDDLKALSESVAPIDSEKGA